MKNRLGCLVITAMLMANSSAQHKEVKTSREVKPVASVDWSRYQGKWFEIARFPNWFQKKCVAEVTAEYQLDEDGTVDVSNRCRKADGTYEEEIGVARVVDKKSKALLEVSFSPDWMSWLPMVWGDYWIIALAPDYSYAVVGVPGRKYLWVMSRTPSMQKEVYDEAVKRAEEQGFDVSKLVKTQQENKE